MSTPPLALSLEGEVVTARLRGEIDMANADDLRRRIADGIPNSALGLVVDLTDVTYLDSSGIRLLFELAERLAARQQALRLVAPGGAPVRRVLGVADPDRSLALADTRAEAFAQLKSVG